MSPRTEQEAANPWEVRGRAKMPLGVAELAWRAPPAASFHLLDRAGHLADGGPVGWQAVAFLGVGVW